MKRLIRFTFGIVTFTAVLFCSAFSACAKSSDAAGLRQTAAGIYRWADEEKLIQSAGSSPADWYLIAAARLGMLQQTTAAKDAAPISYKVKQVKVLRGSKISLDKKELEQLKELEKD